MKKLFMINIFTLILLAATGCSATIGNVKQSSSEESEQSDKKTKNATYSNINPEEAKNRLANEKGIILLDVRTLEEHTEMNIPGSVLIPVEVIEKEASGILTNKNAEIFIYCRSGRRSVTAAQVLIKMGYTNVYNLGGIIDWPYETGSGAPK